MEKIETKKEEVNTKSKRKMKLKKATPFVAAAVTGILILIGSCNLLSKSNGKNRISFINNYRFNITDFDNLVVPSFSVDGESETYDFNGEGTIDNNFTIKLNDGNYIIAPFDYALLIDTDFKMRTNNKLSKELGSFTKAKVNFFEEAKDMPVNGISIEQINGESFFLLDTTLGADSVSENETGKKRILGTQDNIILYNELDSKKAKEKYQGTANGFEWADVVVGGILHRISDLYGYKEVKINGVQYLLICGETLDNGLCTEFLVSKDNCLLHRHLHEDEEIKIIGKQIQADGAKGIFNMQYKNDDGVYLNLYPIRDLVLGADGLYYIKHVGESGDSQLSVIPARHLSLEYNYGAKLTETSFDNVVEFRYPFMFFSTESYEHPYYGVLKLVKVGENYFYVAERTTVFALSVKDYYGEGSSSPYFDGIYSIESVALLGGEHPSFSTSLSFEDTFFPLDDFDMVYNLNNRSFGVADHMGRLAGYRIVNINEIDYYSILICNYNQMVKENYYYETLIPSNKVLLKGSDEIVGTVKSLTK